MQPTALATTQKPVQKSTGAIEYSYTGEIALVVVVAAAMETEKS